jgi:hypothetical protein
MLTYIWCSTYLDTLILMFVRVFKKMNRQPHCLTRLLLCKQEAQPRVAGAHQLQRAHLSRA